MISYNLWSVNALVILKNDAKIMDILGGVTLYQITVNVDGTNHKLIRNVELAPHYSL